MNEAFKDIERRRYTCSACGKDGHRRGSIKCAGVIGVPQPTPKLQAAVVVPREFPLGDAKAKQDLIDAITREIIEHENVKNVVEARLVGLYTDLQKAKAT